MIEYHQLNKDENESTMLVWERERERVQTDLGFCGIRAPRLKKWQKEWMLVKIKVERKNKKQKEERRTSWGSFWRKQEKDRWWLKGLICIRRRNASAARFSPHPFLSLFIDRSIDRFSPHRFETLRNWARLVVTIAVDVDCNLQFICIIINICMLFPFRRWKWNRIRFDSVHSVTSISYIDLDRQ